MKKIFVSILVLTALKNAAAKTTETVNGYYTLSQKSTLTPEALTADPKHHVAGSMVGEKEEDYGFVSLYRITANAEGGYVAKISNLEAWVTLTPTGTPNVFSFEAYFVENLMESLYQSFENSNGISSIQGLVLECTSTQLSEASTRNEPFTAVFEGPNGQPYGQYSLEVEDSKENVFTCRIIDQPHASVLLVIEDEVVTFTATYVEEPATA